MIKRVIFCVIIMTHMSYANLSPMSAMAYTQSLSANALSAENSKSLKHL